MDPGGLRHYRLLAEILTDSLAAGPDPGPRAVEAGREWGRQLPTPTPAGGPPAADREKPINLLMSLLDELGFAPERRQADGQARSACGIARSSSWPNPEPP
jgi:hypothetical protein